MGRRHYNWFMIEKVLRERFSLTFKWSPSGNMEFNGQGKAVVIAKSNNYQPEYVESFLLKLGIGMDEFDVAYDSMNGQSH